MPRFVSCAIPPRLARSQIILSHILQDSEDLDDLDCNKDDFEFDYWDRTKLATLCTFLSTNGADPSCIPNAKWAYIAADLDVSSPSGATDDATHVQTRASAFRCLAGLREAVCDNFKNYQDLDLVGEREGIAGPRLSGDSIVFDLTGVLAGGSDALYVGSPSVPESRLLMKVRASFISLLRSRLIICWDCSSTRSRRWCAYCRTRPTGCGRTMASALTALSSALAESCCPISVRGVDP